MSLSDLPKLWTKPTKIGHIFSKFETQKFEIFDKVVHNFGKPEEVII